MLTRRGWMLALSSVLLVAGGRVLGLVELYMLAAGAAALLVGGLAYVRLARFSLAATRELHPARVHAGSSSRVELEVRNTAGRRSPVVSARDPFGDGRRSASFFIAPLGPGETARAAYRLPTERRGVFTLGPLELHLGDPFGVATSARIGAAAASLTVFPHVDPIEAPSLTQGHDPLAGADHSTVLAAGGEDFYALREYAQGDDLRRVHWKATARLDQLMIRQDEMPWQGRATVVVDLRAEVHTEDSLEAAVSAAASVVTACLRRRSLVRLVTPGVDSGFGAGHAHIDAMLEHLAQAGAAVAGTALRPLLANLRREGNGGALTVITTAAAGADDLEAVARLQARYGGVTLVLLDGAMSGPADGPRPYGAAGAAPPAALARVVRVSPGLPFAEAWSAALRAPGTSGHRTGARVR
ncbi:MAG: DUF58 domain-containing protein [Acidimicrobiales bacterium]